MWLGLSTRVVSQSQCAQAHFWLHRANLWFKMQLWRADLSYSFQSENIIWHDQQFGKTQYTQNLSHDDVWLCAGTTINGSQIILSIQFHSHTKLGSSQDSSSRFSVNFSRCSLPRSVISRSHLPDYSTMMRFEPGSHGWKANVLTPQPYAQTHAHKYKEHTQ